MFCPKCSEQLPPIDNLRFCPVCGENLSASQHAPHDPMIGTVLVERYRFIRLLGEGAMGRVYAAEQTIGSSARHVAVKMMLPHFTNDRELAARFVREAETAARLKHPSTVSVYDFGKTDDGHMYVVMELVDGASLSAELAKAGALSLRRTDTILRQLCGSAAEAHSLKIVHRDLKPDNIMLLRLNDEDYVKVLDFGIAKIDGSQGASLTATGRVLGTPAYMSPEQFSGSEVDGRSDIYAIGVIAYQLVTGELPLHAESLGNWALQHMQGVPKPFEQTRFGASVPPASQQAILRALSKHRDMRQRTAKEFYDEFAEGNARLSAAPKSTQQQPSGGGTIPGAPAVANLVAPLRVAVTAPGTQVGADQQPAAGVPSALVNAAVPQPPARAPRRDGVAMVGAVVGVGVLAAVGLGAVLLVNDDEVDESEPVTEAVLDEETRSAPPSADEEQPTPEPSSAQLEPDDASAVSDAASADAADTACEKVGATLTCGEATLRIAQCPTHAAGFQAAHAHKERLCRGTKASHGPVDERSCQSAIDADTCREARSALRHCPNSAKGHNAAHRRVAELCGGGHHGHGPAKPAPAPAHDDDEPEEAHDSH